VRLYASFPCFVTSSHSVAFLLYLLLHSSAEF
jgi:hypothetical protein